MTAHADELERIAAKRYPIDTDNDCDVTEYHKEQQQRAFVAGAEWAASQADDFTRDRDPGDPFLDKLDEIADSLRGTIYELRACHMGLTVEHMDTAADEHDDSLPGFWRELGAEVNREAGVFAAMGLPAVHVEACPNRQGSELRSMGIHEGEATGPKSLRSGGAAREAEDDTAEIDIKRPDAGEGSGG